MKLNRQKIGGIGAALAACSLVAGLIYGEAALEPKNPQKSISRSVPQSDLDALKAELKAPQKTFPRSVSQSDLDALKPKLKAEGHDLDEGGYVIESDPVTGKILQIGYLGCGTAYAMQRRRELAGKGTSPTEQKNPVFFNF